MTDSGDLLGELIDNKYELDKVLGQGGMGVVYRGRHRFTGRRVAVKFLLETNEGHKQRFLREAQAMGRLSHPNVIDVYDVGIHDDSIFIVMEYLTGRPLTDFIVEGGIPPETAIALIMPALVGVAAAHQANLLHRDLKPDNLFVLCGDDGVPYDTKVLDFGLAKATETSGVDPKLTVAGAILGTPRYMAPEQLEGDACDGRADLFSLGMILFELLTGELSYKAKSLNALLLEVLTTEHPSPRELRDDLPEGLGEVVKQALARDRADRLADVETFARALEPWGDVQFAKPRRPPSTMWNLPQVLALAPRSSNVPATWAGGMQAPDAKPSPQSPTPQSPTRQSPTPQSPTPQSPTPQSPAPAATNESVIRPPMKDFGFVKWVALGLGALVLIAGVIYGAGLGGGATPAVEAVEPPAAANEPVVEPEAPAPVAAPTPEPPPEPPATPEPEEPSEFALPTHHLPVGVDPPVADETPAPPPRTRPRRRPARPAARPSRNPPPGTDDTFVDPWNE